MMLILYEGKGKHHLGATAEFLCFPFGSYVF